MISKHMINQSKKNSGYKHEFTETLASPRLEIAMDALCNLIVIHEMENHQWRGFPVRAAGRGMSVGFGR